MKKIILIINLLIVQLIVAQTITTFSTGYTLVEGVAVNTSNEVFVGEINTNNIFSLDSNGNKTLYATTTSALIDDFDFDTEGNMYVADINGKILKIDTNGNVSDYVLNFMSLYPSDVVMHDNVLYCAIKGGTTGYIYKIYSDLSIELFATILNPSGLAFDNNNNLYVANTNNHTLDSVAPDGTLISILTGIDIIDVAVAPNNKLYYISENDNKVVEVDLTNNTTSDYITTSLNSPKSIAIDNIGNMYITNRGTNEVVKIYDDALLPIYVSIPDVNFKSYLVSNSNINTNGDTEIQFTEAAAYTGNIEVPNMNISDLTGIEAFTEITYLNCGYNQLTELDVTSNTELRSLFCSDNQLSTLDVTNNTSLLYLICSYNQLSVLDVTNNTSLRSLDCEYNQLTVLDVTNNTSLRTLSCRDNQLTVLDVTNNTNLINLICLDNQIGTINVTNNLLLETLLCDGNGLTNLDVSVNTALETLWCANNNLTHLDISSNIALTSLVCYQNQLTNLNTSTNTLLTELLCNNNSIASLDVSTNTLLTHFICSHNLLTSIDVSTNSVLSSFYCSNNQIASVDVLNNGALTELYCSNNQITTLDVSNNPNINKLNCGFNSLLTSIDFRNGNNNIITYFKAAHCPNLSCIYVDDATYSVTNWTLVDNTATFVETEAECTALSIDELNSIDITIYPNPVKDVISIKTFETIKNVKIYNTLGEIISNNSQSTINVSNLSKGMYLIKVISENNKSKSKYFIKK